MKKANKLVTLDEDFKLEFDVVTRQMGYTANEMIRGLMLTWVLEKKKEMPHLETIIQAEKDLRDRVSVIRQKREAGNNVAGL